MYIIVNNTLNTTTKVEGSFPLQFLNQLLEKGNDLIVISMYSNTIKVPYLSYSLDGFNEYDWKEYPLPFKYNQ